MTSGANNEVDPHAQTDNLGQTYTIEKLVNGGSYSTDSNATGQTPIGVDVTPLRAIVLTASTSNSASVYVGGSGVNATNGAILQAGGTMRIYPTDVRNRVRFLDVYITGAGTSGQVVNFIGQA